MENPIKAARTKAGRTLKEFANDCGVHEQAIFLNEQGVYPHILPAILFHLREMGIPSPDGEYRDFVLERRQKNGGKYDLAGLDSLGAPEGTHPVVAFRLKYDLSRMAFAKSFCIHPAELYRLENGQKHGLSEQFKRAMKDAGLPDKVLEELEFRIKEYADGEWIGRDQRRTA